MSTVSLNRIVDVSVDISAPLTVSTDFNLGCIIGNSEVITSADDRIKYYTRATYQQQMVTDGFNTGTPEYKGAIAYFSQNPTAQTLAVGVKLSSETDLTALQNTRAADDDIYAFCYCYATTDSDMNAIAQAVEGFEQPTILLYQTKDVKCLQASQTNVMKTLMDAGYNRTCGFYSTQDGFICAVLGVICGLNSMETNSAYTLAFKSVVGFTPEDVNDVQMQNLLTYNGNVYCNFGRRYNFIYPGLMASSYHVDEQFLLDAAKYLFQQYTVSGFVRSRVVHQTESGMTSVINWLTNACEVIRQAGFIDTGIWNADPVLNLNTGDAISGGYMIQAESLASQNAHDREARTSPTIYIALKASGALEHIVIRAFVNR